MNKNRARKSMAMALSILLVLGSPGAHVMTAVHAEDKNSELSGRSTTEETIFEKGTGDYGYKSLTAEQQALYDRIAENLMAFDNGAANREYTQIQLSDGSISYVPFSVEFDALNISKEDASQVWIAFGADHPWLFWLENDCVVTSTHLMPIVRKSYWGSAADALQKRTEMMNKIEDGVKEYKKIKEVYYQLDYDIVREIEERIISQVDFAYQQDTNVPEEADWAHTIEGVFDGEHNAVVSEGYARAFAFLLNILNIPNVYVTGNVNVEGNEDFHAWNCVSFDKGETYYYMDLTWDDMGAQNLTGNSYQYFAMPKSRFEQKHTVNTSAGEAQDWLYDLPELGDDTDYTYFAQFGSYGTDKEFTSEDDLRGFLLRVRELRPNRLNTCAMKLDFNTLMNVIEIIGCEGSSYIRSEEDDMYIWTNPLDSYSEGKLNATFSLETKEMSIDLGRETEKTLRIANIVIGGDNYVRWHSDNNAVAVVEMPGYTKLEEGASVRIVAKKAGTAVIHGMVSKGGTMTCTVEVTGQRPVVTPSFGPTTVPTTMPTPTSEPTVVPSGVPGESPSASILPVTSPTPVVSVSPSASGKPSVSVPPATSGSPSVSVPPAVSEKPSVSISPAASGSPSVSVPPAASGSPSVSAPPAASGSPSVSVPPAASGKPSASIPPAASGKPSASIPPAASGKPSASSSPAPAPTQGINSGIASKSPSPAQTPSAQIPTQTLPSSTEVPEKAKKVKVGSLYKNEKTGAEYKVTSTGRNRAVTYQGGTKKSKRKVTIPAHITIQGKNYKVTSIANRAFEENKKLKEVSMGKNIKSIGKKAFQGCTKLEKVEIGKNVTAIKDSAFRGCTSLTLLIIPKKVERIGNNAFRDCKRLKYIGVETTKLTLEKIGKNAFSGGHGSPRVKTDEKVWKKYANIFYMRGLSDKSLFVVDPVDLV